MPQLLQVNEVPFEVQDVLLLKFDLLRRVEPASFQVLAPVDAGVSALSQLLQQPVLPRKSVEPAVHQVL